jgi:hypothetical protein
MFGFKSGFCDVGLFGEEGFTGATCSKGGGILALVLGTYGWAGSAAGGISGVGVFHGSVLGEFG